MLIFEKSQAQRHSRALVQKLPSQDLPIPSEHLRVGIPNLPAVSELEVIRHYTVLSKSNFSIDTNFYPLGSCTMKYNPRAIHRACLQEKVLNRHPLTPPQVSQGFLGCLYQLQQDLINITGMTSCSLSPMAGAQGELAGVKMIQAYHQQRKDFKRTEMIVPSAAHGTNPASAAMCGYEIREIPTDAEGDIDLEVLAQTVSEKTAGIMLTNPSTLGIFERKIVEVAQIVHKAGGLLYYDGANLNAILGKARPGDMGFDVMHVNVHKTFATPHGGGGPGGGPVLANAKLAPYLPIPFVIKAQAGYRFSTLEDCPDSIGRLSCFMGNAAVMLRAYLYIRMLGQEGLKRVAEIATLNANYFMVKAKALGFPLAFPNRLATHEFIVTVAVITKETGVTARDIAKRLLDFGIHAPTTYFPLLIPECLLIEPTETESKQQLDLALEALQQIRKEIQETPDTVKNAPHTLPVKRLDDVKAAKALDLAWHLHEAL